VRYAYLWMHLLNAEIDPSAGARMEEHLRRLLGPGASLRLDKAFFQSQQRFLAGMREAWARSRQHGTAPSELTPLVEAASGAARGSPLDGLLAPGLVRSPTTRAQLAPQLVRAALIGFAAYLHDHAFADDPEIVDRCAGLTSHHGEVEEEGLGSSFPWLADAVEVERQLGSSATGSFLRCGKLFLRVGRGDYCSKACRDRSFSLARRQRDPRYDADKQKRYRERVRQTQGAESR